MIDNEYYYEDYESWFVEKFTPYLDLYVDALVSNWLPDKKINKTYYMKAPWINYQKANEYNPPHNHAGDLSFVTYLQVPDEIKEECELSKDQRKNTGPGTINFNYGVDMACNVSSFVRLPRVGDIFIFPSWLKHYVNAFKSDVERISVSGNIFMRSKEYGNLTNELVDVYS